MSASSVVNDASSPRVASEEQARAIAHFLSDSGYNPTRLGGELELSDGPFANGENWDALRLKTEGDDLLSTLARLFFFGWPVESARCNRAIPQTILQALFDCRVLAESGHQTQSEVALIPFGGHIIACDSPLLRGGEPDYVVGPSGTSTQFLGRMAIGGAAETTLDLSTGSGVLSLQAARYSRSVLGTDINERALIFARFNAALNAIDNAEFLAGDSYEPVSGRKFSRILANPPFFLSPAKKFTYCDSPLELDGFARQLTRQAAAHLEEGGFFQMICQWVEMEGEAWEARLREWTANSGCDVLVVLSPRLSPMNYAEVRWKEAKLAQPGTPEFDLAQRVDYLRKRGVKSVMSGIITLRKRRGANWVTMIAANPATNQGGPGIHERFDALTVLVTRDEAALLQSRFRFAADARLEVQSAPENSDWMTFSVELIKTAGLTDRLKLDAAAAGCLSLFDGKRTLWEVADAAGARLNMTPDEARQRALMLAKRLLQGAFILPVSSEEEIG